MHESAKAYEFTGFVSRIDAFKTVAKRKRGYVSEIRFPVFEVTVLSTMGDKFQFLCGRDSLPNLGEKVKCTISLERFDDGEDADAA